MRHKPTDVILRARNGDVIAFDESGLILRLSDQVIADIAARTGLGARPVAPPADLDAWNAWEVGDWLRFEAHLPPFPAPRTYRRRREGGSILADAAGPLLGLLTIGGPAASDTYAGPAAFPNHVLAPADDLGAQGAAGTVLARPVDRLQALTERTQGSATADAVLAARHRDGRAMPLICVRAETAAAPSVASLAEGATVANAAAAIGSFTAIAETLGTRAEMLATVLDLAEDDVTSNGTAFASGVFALVDRIDALCHARGMREAPFLLRFPNDPARLRALWQIAVHPAGRRITVPCPSYAFARDAFGWLTEAGAADQASMDAAALEELSARRRWVCPTMLLAERQRYAIIATFDALAPLAIDRADPFFAGEGYGFVLSCGSEALSLKSIEVDPSDRRRLVLFPGQALPEGPLTLSYANGRPGALRDHWRHPTGGPTLRRWALPSVLEVR